MQHPRIQCSCVFTPAHFRWCAITEPFPGTVIELLYRLSDLGIGDLAEVDFLQIVLAAHSAVGVYLLSSGRKRLLGSNWVVLDQRNPALNLREFLK